MIGPVPVRSIETPFLLSIRFGRGGGKVTPASLIFANEYVQALKVLEPKHYGGSLFLVLGSPRATPRRIFRVSGCGRGTGIGTDAGDTADGTGWGTSCRAAILGAAGRETTT